jgi:hypothetical protein
MSRIYTLEAQEMHAEICDFNITSDGNYFDITHSFNVGSSTYHVLGLRKTRPTYGNTYYIFNCTCDRSQSAKYASVSLPYIHSPKEPGYQSPKPSSSGIGGVGGLSGSQGHGTTTTGNRSRPRPASQKTVKSDITEIKKTLTEIIKSERETLVSSFRKNISVENHTLLLSIEKETEAITEATTTAKNEKQEILRLIEKQKSSLENTFEQHASSMISNIELLKTTITETSNAQHKQLQSLYELQHKLSETIEREVEKIMVKHFETYRSTSLDATTIKQLESTLIETFETCSNTTKADNDDTMKRFLLDQKQQLTDLITKQQQTYALGINEIKKLQTTIIQTINNISIPNRDDQNDNDALKRLFFEQRQFLTDLIREQQESLSLNLIKETVINAIKEQHSSVVSTTISTGMTRDPRPFKISIKTGESAQVFAKLNIDGIEFPSELHTLCQRDPSKVNTVDCFVAPPVRDGPCELTIYAKTKNETEYRAAICILMSYLNVAQPITFPQVYSPFTDYQCVLIEPLRRFLQQNEQVLIHMLIPGAHEIKIRNGDDDIVLNNDEYRHGIVKKKVQIQGNLLVYGRWNRQTDSLICAFEMN